MRGFCFYRSEGLRGEWMGVGWLRGTFWGWPWGEECRRERSAEMMEMKDFSRV